MIINHPSNNDRNFYYLYYVSCIPEQFLVFSPYLDIAPNVLMSHGSSSIKSIPISFGLAQTIHTGTYIIDIYTELKFSWCHLNIPSACTASSCYCEWLSYVLQCGWIYQHWRTQQLAVSETTDRTLLEITFIM